MSKKSGRVAAAETFDAKRRRVKARGVSSGVTTLMYAAQQGNVDSVEKIIGFQVSSLYDRDRTGKTPLHYCCTSDNICAAHAADLIVMAAPDLVDGKDEDGFTPLHLAVIAGNMQLVTFLLANNADVNAVDNEKHTVVHWATVCGETAALRAVLDAGAPVSTPDVHGGYPLHYAAQMCGGDRGSNLGLEVLQTLLSHDDIVVSVADGDKRQPLLWAASAGSARAVLALVRAGANVEAADKDGLTALHCAASRGHTDCMDTLLTLCGASVDVIDSNGCTALHYAVTLGHADATALLLAHGADPNRQDRKGRSPAHCGCSKGQFETVKLIGSHGANLWLRNARGDLSLHEAAASGRRELVKWLLEMRPSYVNARNNDGRCPLHMAALNDNADMCKILLDTGAQVNPVLRTSKNVFMTPLDCALQRGFRSTAKYLQLHGGVPATRLSDPKNWPINSAANLQIREDVTLYGASSSDSERENGKSGTTASGRKVLRKKMSYNYGRRQQSLSGSEQGSGKRRSGVRAKTRSEERSREVEQVGSSKKTPTSSRLQYTNEIIINGRTEINIRQSEEILIDKAEQETERVQSAVSIKAAEIDRRRPKSAKHARTKDKSADKEARRRILDKASSPETIIQQEEARKLSLKDQSTNTSEDTAETVIETKKIAAVQTTIEEETTPPDAKRGLQEATLPERQSMLSYTSEDAEEQKKELVVEASVHAPPKSPEVLVQKEDDIEGMGDYKQGESEISLEEAEKTPERVGKEDNLTESTPQDESEDPSTQLETNVEVSKPSDEVENGSVSCEGGEKVAPTEETVAVDGNTKEDNEEEKNVQAVTDSRVVATLEDNVEVQIEKDSKEIEEARSESRASKEKTFSEVDTQETEGDEVPVTSNDAVSVAKCEEETERNRMTKDGAETKESTVQEKPTDEDGAEILSKAAENESVSRNQSKITKILPPSLSDEEEKVSVSEKTHKSFRILDEKEADEFEMSKKPTRRHTSRKSPTAETKQSKSKATSEDKDKTRRSKIPTPLFKTTHLSKSDRQLNETTADLNVRVPSLPNIADVKRGGQREPSRCESNMSAPPLESVYSENEIDSFSEGDEEERKVTKSKKRVKKRSKTRESRSAGSDYESSNLIDSGFEPSPRSTRVPRWKNVSERGVNMTSVTRNIQNNIRRYHLERKIFQQLLELKRHQIRANRHNEAVLVKRAIDAYHESCASTVGAGRYIAEDFTFKSFEKFLYEALRKLQKNGAEYMRGLPETTTQLNPLLCTRSTNKCMHAVHAYTGVPCAAYLPRMDHHTIPKIGFDSVDCRPGTGFLPTIHPQKKAVTLELSHGTDKQVISLPTDRLDQNKRYYVTFTVKGHETSPSEENSGSNEIASHTHSKSD